MSDPAFLNFLRKLSVLRAPPGQPFILKSGKESMFYVDVRLAALDPRGLRVLSEDLLWTALRMKTGATKAAGVALGGCPLATGVSLASLAAAELTDERGAVIHDTLQVWDALYVRPEPKDHGTGKQIEGYWSKGDSVILFEDVITSGGSSLKAIQVMRDHGLEVKGVVAVLDREEGGAEKIKAECPFVALTTLKELLSDVR